MVSAGAREVFVGLADDWLGPVAIAGVTMVALDVTDQDSVLRAAGSLGGRVDILVNTALRWRPGGPLEPGAVVDARVAMEVAYFGALRLVQAFGPALRGRAEDGGTAWVNFFSTGALAPMAGFFRDAPVQAAAMALAQSLRGALRPVKTLNVLVGPLDDVWHEVVPPPKVAPAALATAVVRALTAGIEDIAVGDIAQDVLARWLDNPDVPARESAG
jgi:NAD(P)-dependent dehydrogenase (short-subunit alcohol dehydrogenase family)